MEGEAHPNSKRWFRTVAQLWHPLPSTSAAPSVNPSTARPYTALTAAKRENVGPVAQPCSLLCASEPSPSSCSPQVCTTGGSHGDVDRWTNLQGSALHSPGADPTDRLDLSVTGLVWLVADRLGPVSLL